MRKPPRRKQPAPSLAASGDALLSTLSGVGPRVAEKLAAYGLLRLQDLWLHLPLRYEDRTRLSAIRGLQPGTPAQVEGRVEAVERSFRFRPMLQVAVGDDSGATLVLRFFHFTAAQVAQFAVGRRVRVYGTPRPGRNGLEVAHPSYTFLADDVAVDLRNNLDPVYPAVEGVGAGVLRRLIGFALQQLPSGDALELLPPAALQAHNLPSLRDALLTVHQPTAETDLLQLASGIHPAQQRLALEELLAYQISLRRQRIAIRRLGALPIITDDRLASALRARLGFVPTAAQERVLAEIHADIARDEPMLRLLQGDVGSGKTVVAALAALRAVAVGRQVALMAPTELLAEQHLATFCGWLEPLGIKVVWLAGKLAASVRREALAALADGRAQMVVGTHALMQEGVSFADLGLAIVDEQHRFGVHQRLALRDKGADGERVPHQLVMTATPIPRTLAMTAYADLDVSVIDELPPGRTPVQTIAASVERRAELIERIRAACSEGRQAYWVCTLIDEETDKPLQGAVGSVSARMPIEAQSAIALHAQLVAQLPELRVGLVHGRMKPDEKQATMRAFKDAALDLLVATTVIEVGVDVPRASLMLVENAERLGLAQLHQLRGRVGRGDAVSTCVLLYQPPLSAMARQRIDTMRRTTDGFVIAQKDLELRGPGELLGTRQTGIAQFRVADLIRDAALLPHVQKLADAMLANDPVCAEQLVARWVGGAERYAGV